MAAVDVGSIHVLDLPMSRPDRLFELIQLLRGARHPLTAARLAEQLEISPRTVYRDVATLQAMRVPIAGEAGIGYVMRPGYDLPPLMFTAEETEAITVGLALLARTGDPGLQRAARGVAGKIAAVLPEPERPARHGRTSFVSTFGAPLPDELDFPQLRQAIREERKLRIAYVDKNERLTERTIWPLAVVYYIEAATIAAWCELRQDLRHFRADRIRSCAPLDERFAGHGDRLRAAWQEAWDARHL
jgi:predicted DNA-binding transcriptional regulator YafY